MKKKLKESKEIKSPDFKESKPITTEELNKKVEQYESKDLLTVTDKEIANMPVWKEVITDDKGNQYIVPTVTKREFALIKRNFYIEELNEIIQYGLEEGISMYTKIDSSNGNFPIEVIFMEGDVVCKQFRCNFEELGFVYKCLKKQRELG